MFQAFKLALILTLALSISMPPMATAQAPAPGVGQNEAPISGTRKQLATIIFAGLAGAILGLSTLSFHGRPQEHLSNIAVGFAIGIIGGTIYTTYRAARAPYEIYDYGADLEPLQNFEFKKIPQQDYTPKIAYTWDF